MEIILAAAVLIAPLPGLLIGICLWKMGSETLFMTSGSLPFEWIERAGSYVAPLALYVLIERRSRMASTTPDLPANLRQLHMIRPTAVVCSGDASDHALQCNGQAC